MAIWRKTGRTARVGADRDPQRRSVRRRGDRNRRRINRLGAGQQEADIELEADEVRRVRLFVEAERVATMSHGIASSMRGGDDCTG
jgi:hypothetical protein